MAGTAPGPGEGVADPHGPRKWRLQRGHELSFRRRTKKNAVSETGGEEEREEEKEKIYLSTAEEESERGGGGRKKPSTPEPQALGPAEAR